MLFLGRTTVGLQMRAAAMDFHTARLLGVRANRVIGSAVLLSGLLAAIVAVLLTVQQPLVTSTFALRETIVVLAGVVVGGMNRLALGDARRLRDRLRVRAARRRAADRRRASTCRRSCSALVILMLLVRPGGLFTRGRGPVERV